MNINIWRIASIVAGLSVLLVAGLFFYFYTAYGAERFSKSNTGFASIWTYFIMLEILIATTLLAIITFPYFLLKSIPLFYLPLAMLTEGRNHISNSHMRNLIGLIISLAFILVSLAIATYYFNDVT